MNHHFRFNNSAYIETEHPRWGLIIGVTTAIAVNAGKELFTHYQYKEGVPFPEDHPWYFETELAIKREERIKKEETKMLRKKKIHKKKLKKV